MKKICLLLLVILGINCSSAQAFDFSDLRHLLAPQQKQVKKEKPEPETPDDSISPSKQAILYYNENNISGAFNTLTAIKDNARTAQDWLLLGNILQDQDKISDADFMYQRAILTDPKNYKAYYNLGNIYLAQEKPYLAIVNYKKAIKANYEFPYAYYNMGCAYLKIGNLKKAKLYFLKAIEMKNTVPDFHYNLAYTYKMLNKTKQAKQYLNNYNKLIENSAQE